MHRALLPALVLASTLAHAQADAGVTQSPTDVEALKRDFEARLEAARREVKDLRDEMRAQLATSSVAQGWQEDWVDEKRKLELVTFDGYLRVRPDLFNKFDMGRGEDPSGYAIFPHSPVSQGDRTQAGVNMRFRLEPTINVSEEVRIRAQIDMLDNLVWGSTPDYAFSRNASNGYWYDRNQFSLFSMSQTTQRSGVNSLQDSIAVKRVWGEVSTPIGILRFGRMGTHWGLGMLYNDGNGIDNDYGDTVDRVSFTIEPFSGFFITPMIDLDVVGLVSPRTMEGGQPFDLSNRDNVASFILAVQRRDTEQERRQKLATGQTVFNYGLHFTYRNQSFDSVNTLSSAFNNSNSDGVGVPSASSAYDMVQRNSNIFIPDLWAKVERKEFRIEAEFAAILGSINGRQLFANGDGKDQRLDVWQFGAVIQGEGKAFNGDLEVGGEVGFASGDKAPGFGNYPRRSSNRGYTVLGDIDGPQYQCGAAGCSDMTINNFRFNRDFRTDMILFRELLGGITDSIYFKVKGKYRITQGLEIFASALYARAIFPTSTPGALYTESTADLGVELNAGVRYETEDGFYAQLQYGVLFPLPGFTKRTDPYIPGQNTQLAGSKITLDNPQAIRGVFGIKF